MSDFTVNSGLFSIVDDSVIVSRNAAEDLFSTLGCVNVQSWDSDVMAQRIKKIALFCSDTIRDSNYQILVDHIRSTGPNTTVVIRNSIPQKAITLPITEHNFKLPHDSGRRSRRPRKRGAVFSFEKCHIPQGATLVLKKDPTITCVVVGDPWVVDFGDNNEESFTARTRRFLHVMDTTYLSPMHYWMYDGKLLRYYYNLYQNCSTKSKKNGACKKDKK